MCVMSGGDDRGRCNRDYTTGKGGFNLMDLNINTVKPRIYEHLETRSKAFKLGDVHISGIFS